MAKKAMTKTEILTAIAADTDLSKKQVAAVFESLSAQIQKGLKGAGVFAIPGLLKIQKQKVPARKAEKHVPNPFKPGEFYDKKAKPASTKIKLRSLKALKDMI